MNVMMQLRKCCNHPYLLEGVEETELNGVTPDPDIIHQKLISASGNPPFILLWHLEVLLCLKVSWC
jgi:SNF2 family DNA or RNA helicase